MKKKMKVSVVALLLLVLSLTACGNHESNAETKSLYARGLEIVQLMSEMTRSEEYMALYVGNSTLESVVQDLSAGDYTTPKAVYAVSVSDENLTAMAQLMSLDHASKELKSVFTRKIFTSLMTRINNLSGVENVAAASVCTVDKTFVNENVNENVIYLYTYDDAVPVAVTFTVGEDHAIFASGVFVMYDGFTCDSAEEIKSFLGSWLFFSDNGIKVTEVLPEK